MDDSSSSIEVETRQKCKVEIPDLQPETDSKERDLMAWELLNNKLKNDSQIWAFFKKVPSYIDNLNILYGPVNMFQGQKYPTLDIKFQKVVEFFAKKYLSGQDRNKFLASVQFFKEHPDINEQILDYSVTLAMGYHEDFSSDVINPLEINQELFFPSNQEGEDYDSETAGNDYSLFIK